MKPGRAVALAMAALLAGCGGQRTRPAPASVLRASEDAPQTRRAAPETSLPQDRRYAQDRDGGPGASIDVSKIPEPVPQIEPRSKYGNRSPYTVLGESYAILPSAKGYVERGIASWYGNKFHGYMTSNFESYDMYKFSAAHKTLPLPSYVRVTNLANNKSVVVRVNDRGPFHQDRVIDLSYAAAVKIGVWPAGTGLVEVRAVGPGDAEEPAPRPAVSTAARTLPRDGAPPAHGTPTPAPARTAPVTPPQLYVQIGSFGDAGNAERVAKAVAKAGLGSPEVIDTQVNGRRLRRVRLGPLKDAAEADRLSDAVRRLGLGKPQVAVD